MSHKSLGSMNDWPERKWTCGDRITIEKVDSTPEEYKKCVTAGHQTREVKKGNCWYQVYCDICGLTWEYDSSD